MKNAKKLLSLLLAILMISACFVACDNADDAKSDSKSESKSEKEKDPEPTPEPAPEPENEEDAVKAVVEDYFDAIYGKIKDFSDLEDALEYCVEDGDEYESTVEYIANMEETITKDAEGFEIDEDYPRNFYVEFENFANDTFEYKIKEVEIKDDEATVTGESTLIDPDEAWSAMVENLKAYKSECEEYDYGYEYIYESAVDNMEEILADVAIVEVEFTITLEKVDGKWLIEELE